VIPGNLRQPNPGGNVVALARGLQPPAALPPGAPRRPSTGLLQTYSSGGRQLLIAYGVDALGPLARTYRTGKVKGIAVIAGAAGRLTTVANAPRPASFEKGAPAWKIPTAILVLGVLLLLAVRLRKVRRRLAELPPPTPAAPLDDPAAQAELAEWERFAQQENGVSSTRPREDAPTPS